jgi:hypothetical protein
VTATIVCPHCKDSAVPGLIFRGNETWGVWVVCPYCRENTGRRWKPPELAKADGNAPNSRAEP